MMLKFLTWIIIYHRFQDYILNVVGVMSYRITAKLVAHIPHNCWILALVP